MPGKLSDKPGPGIGERSPTAAERQPRTQIPEAGKQVKNELNTLNIGLRLILL